jgi:hypothetical protein
MLNRFFSLGTYHIQNKAFLNLFCNHGNPGLMSPVNTAISNIHKILHKTYSQNDDNQYSALGPVLAGTRAQSGDRYGTGTLHSGQVLRVSLPLLSPAFRHSHFHRQMPPCPPTTQVLLVAKGGNVGRNGVR